MSTVIKNSTAARWVVLILVSVTMMMGYVVAKEMSPLQYLLELPTSQGGMGWSSTEFGLFAGSRGFFNVFFLMLFVGGVILDKMGVRFTGLLSSALMVVGAAISYYALVAVAPSSGVLMVAGGLTVKYQVLVAAAGFAVFGIGYEMCGITVSKVIVKWFNGREMALAMGLQVALARLGTALALSVSPMIAQRFTVSTPVLVGLVSVGHGLLVYVVYCMMDVKHDRQMEMPITDETTDETTDEGFRFRDLVAIAHNQGFILITLLCLLYYSALYPFLDFATKLIITKYGVEPEFAGNIPAILPFGSILLTPLFGALYDHRGHGAWLMIVGAVMLTAVLVVFALPVGNTTLAIVLMSILGIAFSLLPASMWPSVPKIVPMKLLGSAYSIIYYIQNIGLMLTPIVIGHVLDRNTTGGHTDYNPAMWVFVAIGMASIMVAVLLLRADHRHNYGLERTNITD